MADRSDTHAPEETIRLKTPGPCEQCGWRFWRGPIREVKFTPHPSEVRTWVSTPTDKYVADCRNPNCDNRVRL